MIRKEGFVLEKSVVNLLTNVNDSEKKRILEAVIKEIYCDFGINRRQRGTKRFELPIEREFGDIYRNLLSGNSKQIQFQINERVKKMMKEMLSDMKDYKNHMISIDHRWKNGVI